MIGLQKAYSDLVGVNWSFEDSLTWDRDELRKWIDGEDEDKKGQKPEYSAVMADEMINMFFSHEWHDPEQMDMIKTLNQCRDRHLFFGGNNPSFFDLNPKVRDRFNFFAFVPERGVAWILVPEKNPFTTDKWNAKENIKLFRKYKHPYNSFNFAFEVRFPDLSADDKKRYLAIRNTKRVESLQKTRDKRDFKTAGKRDHVLGRAVLALMELTDYSQKSLAVDVLQVNPNTLRSYANIGRASQMSVVKKN